MIKRLIIALLSIFIINFIYTLSNSQINTDNKYQPVLPLLETEAFADTTLKINTVNFDNSDSIIFLGTSGFSTGATLSVRKGRLSNPDRVYYDLDNAIVNTPITYNFQNSVLKDLKISQFSRNPDKVRIAITYSEETNSELIRLLKNGNNLIIKLKNEAPVQEYLTQVYRELKDSPYDFNSKAIAKTTNQTPSSSSNDTFNQIQKAFNENSGQMVSGIGQLQVQQPQQKQAEQKLKSRFYIDKMFLRQGNVLLSGIGVVNIEKMMYLTNPTRVVFDMPNTIIANELRNKEIRINPTESIRLGQFEPTKARIVITTPNPLKYRAIYSFDLQGILIAHDDRMAGVKLFNTTSDIKKVEAKQQSSTINDLLIDFSNPIVHSLKRSNSQLEIKLYNVTQSNMEDFRAKIKNTKFSLSKIDYLPYQGIRIVIPVPNNSTIDCYESLNATQLKLTLKTPLPPPVAAKPKPIAQHPQQTTTTTKKPSSINTNRHFDTTSKATGRLYSTSGRLVVLDPGHGGTDTGALRAGIAEKDITLDIAKKTANILKGYGLKVEMTRWNDATVSLQERVEQSNAKRTDIFVSIHINACVSPDAHGIETHYYTEHGYEVAKVIHRNIMANINATNRGLCKSKFYVINHTEAPSVLLELGFISNDNERNALLTEERKQKSAEAIANGIIEYLKTQPKR